MIFTQAPKTQAPALPIGRSFDLLTDADKHLVQERNRGRNFIDIKPEWERLSGQAVAESTLPNRYTRIMFNIAPFSAADDAALLDAKKEVETVFESQKWLMIADAASIAVVGARRNWDAEQLKRRWQTLMENGGQRPETDANSGEDSDDAESEAISSPSASIASRVDPTRATAVRRRHDYRTMRGDDSTYSQRDKEQAGIRATNQPCHGAVSISPYQTQGSPSNQDNDHVYQNPSWSPGAMPSPGVYGPMSPAPASGVGLADLELQPRRASANSRSGTHKSNSRPGSSMGWAMTPNHQRLYHSSSSPRFNSSPSSDVHNGPALQAQAQARSPASTRMTTQTPGPASSPLARCLSSPAGSSAATNQQQDEQHAEGHTSTSPTDANDATSGSGNGGDALQEGKHTSSQGDEAEPQDAS